jgi:hypothetical protein
MKNLKLKISCSEVYQSEMLLDCVNKILDNNTLLAMSSVNGVESHINTVFFAYNENLELIMLTDPNDEHSHNVESNPSVGVAIWNTPEVFGENLQGVQIWGECSRLKGIKQLDGLRVYNNRFPTFSQVIKHPDDFFKGITNSRLYVIKPKKIKIIDELNFGRREYITMNVE